MNIVIIGANAAGMSFAAKYLRNNPSHNVIAFEKKDYVSFGSCGLPYYVGDFFENESEFFARTPKQIIESGIDLRINTTVDKVDFENKLVYTGDEATSYDKLIISTGATPVVPNFGEYSKANFSTLTTLEDGNFSKDRLKDDAIKHVTIIGGGFIGLEIVEACLHLGKKVTLVEAADSILSNQFDSEISTIGHERISEAEVDLQLQTLVQEIKDHEAGYEVTTNNGSFKTDFIFCAVGFRPNTQMFELDKLGNGAIIVDEFNQTNLTDVYAIGDCATTTSLILDKQVYLPLATVANKVGRRLADHLSGKETFLNGFLGSSCLKLIDLEMGRTGLTEQDAIANKIDYKKVFITDKNHTSYYPGQENISAVLIYENETKIILGAQMIGKSGVVHRVNTIAACIAKSLTTSELGYIDFGYAPPFSRTWDVINLLGNVAK